MILIRVKNIFTQPKKRLNRLEYQKAGWFTKAKNGRRGGVAGYDEHLDAGLDELVHDSERQEADLINGLGTVRGIGRVTDVEDLLTGQLIEHGPRNGQASNPGVEHPDRRVIHALETKRRLNRIAAQLPVIPGDGRPPLQLVPILAQVGGKGDSSARRNSAAAISTLEIFK